MLFPPRRLLLACLLLCVGAAAPPCAHAPSGPLEAADFSSSRMLAAAPAAPDPARLHALLINGGGWHEINFRSHRVHLERLLGLLDEAGVSRDNVSVLASDGPDPEPDLAILDAVELPDLWLLPRALSQHLRPQLEYVSTELDGIELRPASGAELARWFEEEGSRLASGDTLLLYVTDHGNKNDADLADNTISLWNGEHFAVRQLQEHLDGLDPGVRVVMLMSQCFGGSFANAIFRSGETARPRGNVCGYFATTADRPAYGCYPEDAGREGVGHSHEVFDALGQLGELLRAHRFSLVTDRTPDVPNTTRDFHLARLLVREAEAQGKPLAEVVDRWLREAWRDRGAWEPEIRLLDQVSHSFGLFSPRSLAELEREVEGLAQLTSQLETYAERWNDALDAARGESWLRFVAAHPEWTARLDLEKLRALETSQRDALRAELLAALASFVRAEGDTLARLEALQRKAEDAREAHYRTEVRIGAVLRMRSVLTSIAGRTWLERQGSAEARGDDERLARCEALALRAPAQVASLALPEPLSQLADDRRLIESVMPAWMGIRYQPVLSREGDQAADGLPRGAVRVITVFPDSPAAAAGIRVADVLVGTPDQRFGELHSVREWTMQREVGEPAALELQRGDQTLEVSLTPGPFPFELPELPGPPKVGSAAPPLEVETYRGELVAQRPRLLFFWATWCGPCKQSVPELLAFAEERDVEVVAITDESPEQLDQFFRGRGFDVAFQGVIATDPARLAFLTYGVSATPTFVLVDETGVILHYQRGYAAADGLRVEGWRYLRQER